MAVTLETTLRYFENGNAIICKAILGKGKPLPDVPKAYIKAFTAYHGIGDLLNPSQFRYNPEYLTVYRNKAGKLFYEIYRDGCFYPYYGSLTLSEQIN